MTEKSLTITLREISHLSLSNPSDALTQLIEESLRILNADSVILNPYNQEEDKWQSPFAAGEFLNLFELGDTKPTSLAQFVAPSAQPYFSSEVSVDPLLSGTFVKREGIKSSAVIPLRIGAETAGVLFLNYRTPHYFTHEEQANIILFAHQIAETLRIVRYGSANDVQFIPPNILRIRAELLSLLAPDEYFEIMSNRLWAIEFIYLGSVCKM